MSNTITQAELRQFTGSENWYRHAINRKVLYTDGVQYVAERAAAYWLIDEIAIIQLYDRLIAAESFQVWKLTVKADHSATLACEDGNDRAIYAKQIEYTDFPAEGIALWFTNNTILLPSEY